ncbi:BRCT domain-containing protein [Paracoccus sp. PS-1]|uniref:BRCT domain-containing protein n=1 Tax=Paracoccus sp. PS1 TaxID=2963938 RepID=UPI0027E44BBF|nr:BRCT domain-containing protein [Paracoccus sp. PS1]MDQ7262261.1 BRCT domain-containing protein [Paracoccus sp. PS1]
MTDAARAGQFLGQRIGEKQVHELIGIARGLLADGHLNDSEIEFLHRWLAANEGARSNPLVSQLIARLNASLADGVIDDDERRDLQETMMALTSNDFELGEVLKSSTLPLCNPAPEILLGGARMCFTGTFTYGTRRECEAAASALGASCGSLTQKTTYLVIGEYATESWKHSSFGNKIMQAVEWRDSGIPISIVSEQHWRRFI